MTTIVVLASILLQRFFHLHSIAYRHEWIRSYYKWMNSKITYGTKGHALFRLAILVVPLLFIVSLLLALIYHLLGSLGYFIANLLLFWICTEVNDLRKHPIESQDFADWFALTYRDFFGPLFWYVFLGPMVLVLFVIVGDIARYTDDNKNNTNDLVYYSLRVQAVLDWIPVRLLGMTYALVGHFKSVFLLLKQELLTSPFKVDQARQLATWALAALQPENETRELQSYKEEVTSLIERALLIWIIVLIILTISFWLG